MESIPINDNNLAFSNEILEVSKALRNVFVSDLIPIQVCLHALSQDSGESLNDSQKEKIQVIKTSADDLLAKFFRFPLG